MLVKKLPRTILWLVALIAVLPFTACGDSSTTVAPNEQESSSSWNIVFSSSSQNIESSSSLSSSEFVPLVAPCKTEMEDYCEYGELVDNRDGQTYKTVKIGSQTWMAENLNFKVDSSFCFNNEESYCSKYGRLYSWAAAVGKSEAECGFGYICSLPPGNIRGVCPEGWHLPDSTEWNVLFDVVGVKKIGTKVLKSMSGWDNNGSDAYGFSVLPAGWRKSTRGNFYGEYSFGDEGRGGYFWSASEIDGYEVDVRGSYRYPNPKGLDFSVRCVQDDASEQNSIISSSSVKSSSVSPGKPTINVVRRQMPGTSLRNFSTKSYVSCLLTFRFMRDSMLSEMCCRAMSRYLHTLAFSRITRNRSHGKCVG